MVIIPDGAADLPMDELGGRTPLEAAETPNLKALAARGRVGVAATTPEGFEAGSDVCSMSLLGYDPTKYHTGRAPLEAAALGLTPGPSDWIFRVNLVMTGGPGTPEAGRMLDHSAGAITDREARALIADLVEFWGKREGALVSGMTLTPGVSYRNILVDARASSSGRDYSGVKTTPPHAIPGEPWESHLPVAAEAKSESAAAALRALMLGSAEFLPGHPVNRARVAKGLRPATMAWIWGQGTRPSVPSFASRFGLRGAMITSVDLLAGIASYIGWTRLEVPGLTSYHDTDYKAQGRATCEAIGRFDVVCSHVEAPDEASHQGDWKTKVASIEAIDREVVGPVVERLERYGDAERGGEGWRVLVMPDHYTLCSTRKHDATPVPFVMAGSWIRSAVKRGFTEKGASGTDLVVEHGHDLMEYFLKGGLAQVKKVV